MVSRTQGRDATRVEDDDYARVRWRQVVAALVEEGVDADRARLCAGRALVELGSRRHRSLTGGDRDRWVWARARAEADLPPRPGEGPPVVDGDLLRLPHEDPPDPWLRRAEEQRRQEGRHTLRGVVAALVVALVAVGVATWWEQRPQPPQVREEENPLPVLWYASDELHLPEVVVELPDVAEFVPWRDGAVVRRSTGDLLAVGADGEVSDLDEAPAVLDDVPSPPFLPPLGRYDEVSQSVRLADGGWAFLVDSSRRVGDGEALRLSETGRRAVVVCSAAGTCEEPQTLLEGTAQVRLR